MKDISETADQQRGESAAEGESSNLADKHVGDMSVSKNAVTASAKESANLSQETDPSESLVEEEMETSGEDESSEWVEVDCWEEEDCEDGEEGYQTDESGAPREMEDDGNETDVDEGQHKGKRSWGAEKRKMRMLQALAAGGAVLPREEEDATDSEAGDTKELKNSTDAKKAPVRPEEDEETVISTRLAVVLVGFPHVKMTEKQAELLETAIVQKINPSNDRKPIQFSATQYENGGLAITCDNRATKEWLYKTAVELVPWPGARLMVGQADFMFKGRKFILWLVNRLKKKDSRQVLDLIQYQNRGISTVEWRILRRVSEGKNDSKQRLTIWVDSKSFEDLKTRNFRLFLGLSRFRLTSWAEWTYLNESLPKSSTVRNLPRNYRPRQRAWTNSKSQNFLSPLLPHSAFRVLPQSRRPELSSKSPLRSLNSRLEGRDRSQRREPAFADVDPPRFNKTKLSLSNRTLPQESKFTNSRMLQNRANRSLVSEQHRGRRFGVSERSRSRETDYGAADRAQPRESTYISDRPQGNRYVASGRRKLHEPGNIIPDRTRLGKIRNAGLNLLSTRDRGYAASDQPSSRGSRYTVSDQTQSRNSKYVPSDRPQSRDSRYSTSSRDQPKNPRFGSSNQLPSRESRIRRLDEPSLQESRLRASGQVRPRVGRSAKLDLPYSHKSRLTVADPPRFREVDKTVSRLPRSREGRISGSDYQQPKQARSSYTSSKRSRL